MPVKREQAAEIRLRGHSFAYPRTLVFLSQAPTLMSEKHRDALEGYACK